MLLNVTGRHQTHPVFLEMIANHGIFLLITMEI